MKKKLSLLVVLSSACLSTNEPAEGTDGPEGLASSSSAPIRAVLFPGRWAYGADEAYLVKGSVVPVAFLLSGDTIALEYPITFELQVPPTVKLHADWSMTKATTTNHHRYQIKLAEHDVTAKLNLREGLNRPACIEVWAEATERLENAELRWNLSFAGFRGPEKTASLIVKPSIQEGPRPDRFSVLFVWSLHHDVPRPIWDRVYEVYRRAGINTYLARGHLPQAGTWRDYCLKRFRENGARVFIDAPDSYAEERPLRTLGTVHWEPLVAGGGVGTLAKMDEGHTARWADKVDGFYWDFEATGGQIAPHQEARDLFAHRKGLEASTLTAEIIDSRYKAEYEIFCENLVGEVANVWAEFVRQYRPDASLFLCHGDHMDPAVYRHVTGMTHQPMIYTGTSKSFIQVFEEFSNTVTKDVWPFAWNGLVKADKRKYVAKSPRDIRMDMMAIAALGGTGFGHWPDFHRAMDGLYLWEMARAARAIGQVEPFFIHGNRIDQAVEVVGLPESETEVQINGRLLTIQHPDWSGSLVTRAYQIYNERLIAILNMDSDRAAYLSVSANVTGPSTGYKVYDAVSGASFVKANDARIWNSKELRRGFTLKVEPMDAIFLRIGLEEIPSPALAIDVTDTHRAYMTLRSRSESARGGGVLQEDDLEVTWDDIDADGSLEVLLASPVQRVWITPSGGRVWGWKVDGRSRDLIRTGETLGAAMDLFWMPNVVRWNTGESNPYQIIERTITNGRASVTVEKSIQTKTLPGLLITKTYSIDVDSRRIQVDVKFTSQSSEPRITFGYWSHSSFDMGNKEKLVCPGPDGNNFIEPDGTVHSMTICSSALTPAQIGSADEFDPAAIKGLGLIAKGWAATYAADTEEAVVVTLDHDTLLQIYKWQPWSSDEMDTLEWMYKAVTLRPQESWQTQFVWEYNEKFPLTTSTGRP